jgi:UDP-N-acetylmuramate--alanine ligase
VALASAWVVAGGDSGGDPGSGAGERAGRADRLLWGLTSFPGIGRRLERKGEARGVVVYDDYGHHPTAIRATLAALRQREPGRRLWAVYEPLTVHRTAAMLDEFAAALADADAVAVAKIWASRDPDTTITSAEALANAVRRHRPGIEARAPGTVEETAAWLARSVAEGDAVLVMGGGKSYRIAELLLEILQDDPSTS